MGLNTFSPPSHGSRVLPAHTRCAWLQVRGSRLLLLLSLLVVGCSDGRDAELTGRVTNLFGHPVAARISLRGMDLRVVATAQGEYRLPYVPGQFLVRYEAPGHFPVEMPWQLFEATRVKVAPITLVPEPTQPGLWMPSPEGYQAVPTGTLQVEDQSVLGLSSGSIRSVRIEGAPLPWCKGIPLIFAQGEPGMSPPFSAWTVDPGGHVWSEGRERLGRPRNLTQERLAEGVWRITSTSSGTLGMLLERLPGDPTLPVIYHLDARTCTEVSP